MMPEFGNGLLCLALGIALLLFCYPLYGAWRGNTWLMKLAPRLSLLLFVCVAGAFAILIHAFVVNDFTLRYVTENSNTLLPLRYRMAAAWGAHEGSLLLWVTLMSGWTLAVAQGTRTLPPSQRARILAVMGGINLCFLLFILATSNPFARTLPDYPIDGRDLNPMLQDPGLIFHPPLLYMGYVGFSVAFAFALTALLERRFDGELARRARSWTLAAWICLTLGITLGSFWAYYELGWGGWWFWDPVENASLMPWLAGTALLHSLSTTEQRGVFKSWSMLLAIGTFALCLLGTFLVRSGVLISVHAFAADPVRGVFILAIMTLIVGGALLLFALRAGHFPSRGRAALCSRESALLANNLLLTTAMLVVLLGTLLPLIHRELGLGAISVGAPFFNLLFTVLMVPLSLLMGVSPLLRWGRDRPARHRLPLRVALCTTLVLAFVVALRMPGSVQALTVLGLFMALWIVLLLAWEIRIRRRQRIALPRRFWGMAVAHLGVAVTVTGIAFHQNHALERDVRMAPGSSVQLAGYQFTFREARDLSGPNYQSRTAFFTVTRGGSPPTILQAEKRYYAVSQTVMTEAAIDGGVTRDLYIAPGEVYADGAWDFRLSWKPFIRWIWAGGVLMALGGLLSLPLTGRKRALTGDHKDA
ncbi:heme lyase CcmF/NrfE family subunit [uncultured Leclercia sp.]|uniref:heme lyase CcmF/NrfE family subunit n=1 Tax=uncultured Leclercia sp. TaxID=332959 RepID=UPI002591D6DD|nr:heme lyase CcmF/NrfE family subunit [uncultured Leclercia sp.]